MCTEYLKKITTAFKNILGIRYVAIVDRAAAAAAAATAAAVTTTTAVATAAAVTTTTTAAAGRIFENGKYEHNPRYIYC